MSQLDELTRRVAQLVGERIPAADSPTLEVVVREVVAAVSGAAEVPPPSTPPPPVDSTPSDEGTVTTARGSLVTEPSGGLPLNVCSTCLEREREIRGNRAVVTTTGANRQGLLAGIAGCIAERGGDILDVSQTIVSDFFTMIMVVDLGSLTVPFEQFKDDLVATSRDMGIHAVVVHEDVMQALQRV